MNFFRNMLGSVCVLIAGFASAQEQPTNPNAPQVVPPQSNFRNGSHMRLVMPCSNQLGSLDRYLRNSEGMRPLFMAKGMNHLLMVPPNSTNGAEVELRVPSGVVVYTDGEFGNSEWALIVVYENGVECLMTVGDNFQPWIGN
jgi:hypothetical protein